MNRPYKITYTDAVSLVEEAGRLIEDASYRKRRGGEVHDAVVTPEQFGSDLKKILTCNTSLRNYERVDIDYDAFCEGYIDRENHYTDTFKRFVIRKFKFRTAWLFPRVFRWFVGYVLSGRLLAYLVRSRKG